MKAKGDRILRPEQAAYLEALEPARDALLAEIEVFARAHGNQPISDPEVASFLAVTARAARPRAVLEVGTNLGYGAIVLARAAADARVVTLEKSPELCKTARDFVARAGLSDRVEVREADALEALAADASPVDFVYVDCVKEDYPRYFDLLVPRLTPGGVLVADNVLWRGLVAAADTDVPEHERVRVDALRAFNRRVVTDARLRGVVLPLGDGVAFATRL